MVVRERRMCLVWLQERSNFPAFSPSAPPPHAPGPGLYSKANEPALREGPHACYPRLRHSSYRVHCPGHPLAKGTGACSTSNTLGTHH